MMRKTLLTLTLAATTLAGVAVAQTATTPAAPAAKVRADTNGDGAVTKQEAMARAEAMFARADANRDGTLTAAERQAARPDYPGMRGHRDGGGWRGMHGPAPTAEQRQARLTQRFDRIDANHNGSIDRTEFAAIGAKWAERRGHGDMPPR